MTSYRLGINTCFAVKRWPRPEGISFPGKYHSVPENLGRIVREVAKREHRRPP